MSLSLNGVLLAIFSDGMPSSSRKQGTVHVRSMYRRASEASGVVLRRWCVTARKGLRNDLDRFQIIFTSYL